MRAVHVILGVLPFELNPQECTERSMLHSFASPHGVSALSGVEALNAPLDKRTHADDGYPGRCCNLRVADGAGRAK